MIPLLLRFKSYLIVAGILSAMFGWGMWERSGKLSAKAELTVLQVLHDKVVKDNKRKEVENDERIKTAAAERDSLHRQLRDNQIRLSTLQRTLTTSRSGKVCFREQGFATALSGITGLLGEGETGIINAKTLLDSWPK